MERQLLVVVKRIGILRGLAALAGIVVLLASAGGSDRSVLHAWPAQESAGGARAGAG